jgi:glycosyltransferase involved in cell wall biosynthesis
MGAEPRAVTPRVSVAMCAYNGLGLIENAVADILRQSFTDWELVISDDGSTDGTLQFLKGLEDPRIRVISQTTNLGYVRNKNAAIAACRGNLITQQDQDDRSDQSRLKLQVAAMHAANVEVVACGFRRISLAGRIDESPWEPPHLITGIRRSEPYPFWFPSLMFSRKVLNEIGPFDDYFAGAFGDDLYWTVKANERFPIWWIPDRLYDYVESEGSITSRAGDERKLAMRLILDHLIAQRESSGTDDLADGRIGTTERKFTSHRALLANEVQTYAARAIDQKRWDDARSLLKRSFAFAPMRPALLRTLFYYLRARLRLPRS